MFFSIILKFRPQLQSTIKLYTINPRGIEKRERLRFNNFLSMRRLATKLRHLLKYFYKRHNHKQLKSKDSKTANLHQNQRAEVFST